MHNAGPEVKDEWGELGREALGVCQELSRQGASCAKALGLGVWPMPGGVDSSVDETRGWRGDRLSWRGLSEGEV